MVDRARLFKIALGVLAVAGIVGWLVGQLGPRAPVDRAEWLHQQEGLAAAEAHLIEHLKERPDDEEAWRTLVRQRGLTERLQDIGLEKRAGQASGADELQALLQELEDTREPHLDEDSFDRFLARAKRPSPGVLRALYGYWRSGDAGPAVKALRALDEPSALVEAARVALDAGEDERALALADEALTAADLDDEEAGRARALALSALDRAGLDDELQRRLEEPAWRDAATPRHQLDQALRSGDPLAILIASTKLRLSRLDELVHLGALVGGACWLIFLLVLGGARAWTRPEKLTATLALGLGVVSGVLTLAAAIWLNHSLGHDSRPYDEAYLLAYMVLGVGFKEEAIKLLCFAPLIPLLLRARHELVIVLVASFVGLGFAVEENTGYFAGVGGDVGLGRFLTANFLHLSLTGIAGYALVNAVRRGGEAWSEFTTEFFKVVAIHGLYDYLLTTRIMEGLGFFSMMVFVIIAQFYLRLVLPLPRPTRIPPGRLLTVFVVCLSVAFGANLVLMSTRFGLGPALVMMAGGALGTALIAYMFFRELDD